MQDAHGCIRTGHLAALAEVYNIPQAEVFEVASFYHHFVLVADGETPPPRTTVRVCTSIACALAGAESLLRDAIAGPSTDVRVVPASCLGQCDRAPAALVNGRAITDANVDPLLAACATPRRSAPSPVRDLARSLWERIYAALGDCPAGRRTPDDVIAAIGTAGLLGLGGAGDAAMPACARARCPVVFVFRARMSPPSASRSAN